jgi:hypothetical protein
MVAEWYTLGPGTVFHLSLEAMILHNLLGVAVVYWSYTTSFHTLPRLFILVRAEKYC